MIHVGSILTKDDNDAVDGGSDDELTEYLKKTITKSDDVSSDDPNSNSSSHNNQLFVLPMITVVIANE